MRVESIMRYGAVIARASESLQTAARRMAQQASDALVVLDDDGKTVCGMLSADDIRGAAYSTNRDLDALCVAQAMEPAVPSCRPWESVYDVAQTMARLSVEELPVVSDEGFVVGVVSRADIVDAVFDATTTT